MLLIDFSRICLPIWQPSCLPCPTKLLTMSPFKRDHKMVSPPWCSFLEKFGDHALVAVTTVRLSVDCICSGRIVLFAPVEHQLFVPITFFQLSHCHPDVSSNVQMFLVESSTVHCSYVSSSEKHNAVTKTIKWP